MVGEGSSTTVEPRIPPRASVGFSFRALLEAAGKITVPVEHQIPWEDEEFDRTSGVALFDALASKEKTLHAHSGRHYPVPDYERDSSDRFFARHLGRTDPHSVAETTAAPQPCRQDRPPGYERAAETR